MVTKNMMKSSSSLEEFYDAVDEAFTKLDESHPPLNNQELIYLMMGSIGKIAEAYKQGGRTPTQVYDQCVALAAACQCIALNQSNVQEKEQPMTTRVSKSFFFHYKHHSENMTKLLMEWVELNVGDSFDFVRPCGMDKKGDYLIGFFDEQEEVKGFITCPDADTRYSCLRFLDNRYPTRVDTGVSH